MQFPRVDSNSIYSRSLFKYGCLHLYFYLFYSLYIIYIELKIQFSESLFITNRSVPLYKALY